MQTLRGKAAEEHRHAHGLVPLRDDFIRRVHALTEHNHRRAILSPLDGALPRHLLHPEGSSAYEPETHAPTPAMRRWRETQGAYIAALCGLDRSQSAEVKHVAADCGVARALRLAHDLAGAHHRARRG